MTKKLYVFFYQILLLILLPLALVYLFYEAKKRGGKGNFILQRMGFGFKSVAAYPHPYPLWIHAASLGEVNAIKPLIEQIRIQFPEWHILVSSNTVTGAAAIQNLGLDQVQHVYLPLDLIWAVRNFLNAFQPQRCLIVETEIWPNLYRQSAKFGCPPSIVNGRLSQRTIKQKKLFPLYQYALSFCEKIYTRSKQDSEYFKKIGADSEQLLSVGNIKFSAAYTGKQQHQRLIEQSYILAASTHADEETQLCEQLLALEHLLVIVPRHIERSTELQKQFTEMGIKFSIRSLEQDIEADTQVYLADTMGEMQSFMAYADAVFMGGSLIEHGGQNLLEAAQLGRPILSGPHTYNFEDEVSALKAVDGIIEVNDAQELNTHLKALLKDQDRMHHIGTNARELVFNNSGIVKHYIKLLKQQWRLNKH